MDSKHRPRHFDTVVFLITFPTTYHHRNLATEITSLHGRDIWKKFHVLERLRIKIKLRAADSFYPPPVFNLGFHSLHIRLVLMMDPDMDSKLRICHFDTVVSPITSPSTYHHRNLATEITSLHGRDIWQKFRLLERLRIKIKMRAADLNFLKQCRDKKIPPGPSIYH